MGSETYNGKQERADTNKSQTNHWGSPGSLLEGTVKIDIFVSVKKPPAGRHTNCEPSAADHSWKGGARERADDVFFAAGKMSKQSGLCSDVGYVDEKDTH